MLQWRFDFMQGIPCHGESSSDARCCEQCRTAQEGCCCRLQDAEGHHNSALFVGPVPYQPADGSWDEKLDGYVAHLLSICDRFAPGVPHLVQRIDICVQINERVASGTEST